MADPVQPVSILGPQPLKSALALIMALGFIAVIVMCGLGYMKLTDNPTVLMLFGSLSALAGQVYGFYFGSSSSSERKTEIMNQTKE